MNREEFARRFDMRLLKIFIGFVWAILGLFVTADRAYAVFPGVNGKIVFVGNQSGTWQLYTVNGDGSGLKQITHMPTTGFELWLPAFSPDGERILFTHDPPDNPCGLGVGKCVDLYVVNADGTGLTRLTHDGISWAGTWSPDGSEIVFNEESLLTRLTNVVTKMRADGTGGRSRLSSPFFDTGFSHFTPDGRNLIFYSQAGGLVSAAWNMESSGEEKRRLTPAYFEGFPFDVSPDGKRILLMNHQNTDLQYSIFTMSIHGGQLLRITRPPGQANDTPGTYSPDGKKIVFVSDRLNSNQSLDLFTMNSDGTDIRRIASGITVGGCPDRNCVGPSWGPKR
jgi:Tol biopolymer transport system component